MAEMAAQVGLDAPTVLGMVSGQSWDGKHDANRGRPSLVRSSGRHPMGCRRSLPSWTGRPR